MKAGLSQYQIQLLKEGPRSLAQSDAAGNVRSVEDTKGDQGSRTTRLSEQSEGVGGVSKEIPDPWD